MDSNDDLPLFPVTGWEVGVLGEHEAVFIRLAFRSHALQKPEEFDQGRRYVFQREQLAALRAVVDKAIQALENGAPQASSPSARH
jgi:hypothetical protein